MSLTEVAPLEEREQEEVELETGAEPLGEGAVEGEEVEEEPKPTPPMQIALPGDWETISSEFGGATPETSEIRLLGGKMPIEGSFAKGTRRAELAPERVQHDQLDAGHLPRRRRPRRPVALLRRRLLGSSQCDEWFFFDAATNAMIKIRGMRFYTADQPLRLAAKPIEVKTK